MSVQKKKEFLINCAYWAVIIAAGYLVFEYLVPICVPVIIGMLIAWLVVGISNKIRFPNRVFRILLSLVIYGLMGLTVGMLAVRAVSGVTGLIKWLPRFYELKLQPFAMLCYNWAINTVAMLNPTLVSALESVLSGALTALESLFYGATELAVGLVSGIAKGVPSVILSMLTMIFTTIFLVADYDRIHGFASEHIPQSIKKLLKKIRFYLTDTLFVVIRSYAAIMLLTFTELSILFAVFGIERPVLKAAVIALLDIMPILGTGGIMIPWAVTSLVLGYTKLGIELFIIYGIVTVVRNYVEPKIVGGQLGLHPIITLVSMFIGLRLFGIWGLFGFPVGISFLWKERMEKPETATE
jgi:sporulation integral membrane protein YtvI